MWLLTRQKSADKLIDEPQTRTFAADIVAKGNWTVLFAVNFTQYGDHSRTISVLTYEN